MVFRVRGVIIPNLRMLPCGGVLVVCGDVRDSLIDRTIEWLSPYDGTVVGRFGCDG